MNEQNIRLSTEESIIDAIREVHVEYTESLGDAYKKVKFDTFATFDELCKALHVFLRGDDE